MNHSQIAQTIKTNINDKRVKYISTNDIYLYGGDETLKNIIPFTTNDILIKLHFEKLSGQIRENAIKKYKDESEEFYINKVWNEGERYEVLDVREQTTEFIGNKEEVKEYLFNQFLGGRGDIVINKL